MQQHAFLLKTRHDLEPCLRVFREHYHGDGASVLISLYSGWKNTEDIESIGRQLTQQYPAAIVSGCTSSGEILSGALSVNMSVLIFMVFADTQLKLLSYDLEQMEPHEAARHFLAECEHLPYLVGIQLLITQRTRQPSHFIKHLTTLDPNIPVFGGVAGEPAADEPFLLIGGSLIKNGIIAILFQSQTLHIQINTCQGWQPLGQSLTITAMKDDNIIKELNYQPATAIYEKYLKLSPKNFMPDGLAFPLFVKRGGVEMARVPSSCTADGAIQFFADCQLGETVRLAYGNPEDILDMAHHVQYKIAAFAPEGLLLFNCLSRRTFLREDSQQELRPFQYIAANAGLYTLGEIAWCGGRVSILNTSMLAVSFREGAPPDNVALPPHLPKPTLEHNMSLVQRLANFVAATTAELEDANRELKHLNQFDRLTGIYNRGKIESLMKKELKLVSQIEHAPLSIIMMDLDNFKQVNDTYGHDKGDQLLQYAAQLLLQAQRHNDAVGRWGGEEFLMVLPGTSAEEAFTIAEGIRLALEESRLFADGRIQTASFGIAACKAACTYQELYRRVDAALYEAKRSGKNRVFTDESLDSAS